MIDLKRFSFLITLCLVIFILPGSGEKKIPKISIVVGSLLPGEGKPDKIKNSPLSSPFGIDFDSKGNLFIVELGGGRVHKLTPTGNLSLLAGNGTQGYQGDNQIARQATFNGMHNVAVTPSGDIYIADSWNHCIRKINAKTQIISTIAGTGNPGFSGDGGIATQATFNYVMCITLNNTNDKLFVADLKNRRIRTVDLKNGLVETIAGNGNQGVPEDGSLALESPLVDPRAVAVDSKNRIYILERSGHALRIVDRTGNIYTVAGTGEKGFKDGPALEAQFNSPKHLCIDIDDNVIIADDQNQVIRKFNPQTKIVTTILGQGIGDPPVQLKKPHGVCIEKNHLYVVDTGNNRILRLDNLY